MRLFHYRHQVIGKEHIPENEAVIFAANHQNAPMDAFNIICNCGKNPYFATRGDLFKKPILKKILLSLKMYPVFRLRDGRENMKQNEDAFDFFSSQLLKNNAVGIFPEGAASYQHQLLPLKKGMARLAFQTLEKNPDKKIFIIPTGLQYHRKYYYQSDILIQFGKPIPVHDYKKKYLEHKAKAIRKLTQDTALAMQKLIIHIPDKNYDEINQKRIINYENSDKELIARFKEGLKIVEEPLNYSSHKKNKKNKFWKIPLSIFGLIFHYPIRNYFEKKTQEKIKDNQFFATSNFIRGYLFFPFYYFILGCLITYFFSPIYLLCLLFLSFSGRWAYHWMKSVS